MFILKNKTIFYCDGQNFTDICVLRNRYNIEPVNPALGKLTK